jgi:hypothetical protein
MSVSPVIALRKAIRARLTGDAALASALGGAQVFDEAPREAEPPYILFGEVQMRDWSTFQSPGVEQLLTLSAVSTQRGLSEALDIGDKIVELLDEAPLVLEGHLLIDLRFQTMETRREQNGRFARVSLRFRATTESA